MQRDSGEPGQTPAQALQRAADAARHAPSVHNTQPWRWLVHPDRLELYAATARQLREQDPQGQLLVLSCGAALHHARVALAAQGWSYEVERPAGEPLAVLRPGELGPADPGAVRHVQTMQVRRTDRRTVSEEPVDPQVLRELTLAATGAGVQLDVLDRDRVLELAAVVDRAQRAEGGDDRLRAETRAWTGDERPAGAGVPGSAIPAELPATTVGTRDFHTAGTLAGGAGHDRAATYAVLSGPADESVDWLRAGEALSAMWITAVELGVTVLPVSSPVEVPFTRLALRRMLGDLGWPYLVVRLGTGDPEHAGPPPTPRLDAAQVIDVAD